MATPAPAAPAPISSHARPVPPPRPPLPAPPTRLYVEARGEENLRDPGESSMGFLVHRGPPPDRAGLHRRLAELAATCARQ